MTGDEFDLRYAPHTVSGLLDQLRGLAAESAGLGQRWLLDSHFVSTFTLIESGAKAVPMQALLAACVHKRCVDIDYVSRRRLSRIRFSPHAPVACAMRPHFRGFAVGEKYERYSDIVPGRIRAVHSVDKHEYVDAAQDSDWHTCVDLVFAVNAGLPEPLRNSVIEENDGSDHLEVKNVRRAVEIYVCREIVWRYVQDGFVLAWRLAHRSPSRPVLKAGSRLPATV